MQNDLGIGEPKLNGEKELFSVNIDKKECKNQERFEIKKVEENEWKRLIQQQRVKNVRK